MVAAVAALTDWRAELRAGVARGRVFETLERLLVPGIADWCVIYLRRPDGDLEPVAAAHRDAALTPAVLGKARAYPPLTSDTVGAGAVARTGREEYLPDIPAALVPALCRDEAHVAMLGRLGLRASLTLPFLSGERVLGVVRLAKREDGFSSTDLETARDIAAHAAEAIAEVDELERTRTALHRERRARRVAQVDASRYRALLDASPVSTQILSSDGRTVEVNRAWQAFWGIRIEDDPSYHESLFANEQLRHTGVLEFFERALSGERLIGPPTRYDPTVHTPGGQARWIRAHATPVQSSSGRVREVIITHEELTTVEQAEAARRLRALGLHPPGSSAASGDDPLSARERAVLHLIADGRSNKGIAKLLSISENTAKFHVTSVFNKLGVNSRAMAVSQGVQLGLI